MCRSPAANDDRLLLAQLNPIERSLYVEECMEGTRTDVIATINSWISDVNSRNIFWLKGSPGAGKSTIAATVVAQLRNDRRLGSHFFFRSGHDTLGSPHSLWRTFAADMAKFDPVLRIKILQALRELRVDPTTPNILAHFRHLIQEPLQNSVQSLSRYPVFVIDAVDECATNEPHRKILLDTLRKWTELPGEFKLLLTSRDYPDIAASLRTVSSNHILRTGDLVDQNSYDSICVYLRTSFRKIATSDLYEDILSPDWPGDVIQQLAERAAGLFIWAATIIKLFEGEEEDPQQQLSLILADSSLSNIDALYSQILESAFGKSSSRHIDTFKKVVGGILAAKIPLCHPDLVCLLGLDHADTLPALILRKLRPVISSDSSDACLHISHQSFADFICNSKRCSERYVIDCRESNDTLAVNCLKIMNDPTTGLRFNICQFPTSHLPNEAVPGLDSLVKTTISSALSYACHFWVYHWCALIINNSLVQDLHTFLTTKLLYWLEALSLMKSMPLASLTLQLLSQRFKVCAMEFQSQFVLILICLF
jgi:hypothetical protein